MAQLEAVDSISGHCLGCNEPINCQDCPSERTRGHSNNCPFITWGDWHLSATQKRIPTLDYHHSEPRDDVYWIPLPIYFDWQIDDWIAQVEEKNWSTPQVLSDLRRALGDLKGLVRQELDAVLTQPSPDELADDEREREND